MLKPQQPDPEHYLYSNSRTSYDTDSDYFDIPDLITGLTAFYAYPYVSYNAYQDTIEHKQNATTPFDGNPSMYKTNGFPYDITQFRRCIEAE